MTQASWHAREAAAAFATAVVTHMGDDITFKFLCNAFPGLLFIFVSTLSPILLAFALIVTTVAFRWCDRTRHPDVETTKTTALEHDLPHRTADVSHERLDAAAAPLPSLPLWLRPNRPHAAIAILDQLVTLLATAGGPGTPGHAQVVLNQTKLPLTALFSAVAFGRRFSRFQVLASAVLVSGSALVGAGAISEGGGQPSDDGGAATALGRGPSVALFAIAQIPCALAGVWRERMLKTHESPPDQRRHHRRERIEDVPAHLRILQLATLIGMVRAVLALVCCAIASLSSRTVTDAMREGIRRFGTNEERGASWIVVNTFTWVLSKLGILWVSAGRGGAFLSCVAAAVALPIEFGLFCALAGENPATASWFGLLLSFVGMGLYLRAAPEEFSSSRDESLPSDYNEVDDDDAWEDHGPCLQIRGTAYGTYQQ